MVRHVIRESGETALSLKAIEKTTASKICGLEFARAGPGRATRRDPRRVIILDWYSSRFFEVSCQHQQADLDDCNAHDRCRTQSPARAYAFCISGLCRGAPSSASACQPSFHNVMVLSGDEACS